MHLRLREAQAGQELLRTRVDRVGIGVGQRGVDVAHAQAVLGAFRFGLQCGEFRFQLAQRDVAINGVFDRGAVERWRLLSDVGHSPGGRVVEVALIGMQRAAQQPKETRLARAIGADEADLVAGVQKQVDLVEQRLDAAHE